MRIITISREFGSGGRELGKRLADALGVPCYDKEVLAEVAKQQGITPEHVERITMSDIRRIYPVTIGHTLTAPIYFDEQAVQVFASQQGAIKRLAAQGDCVFVGRSADVILEDLHPMNLFVYASRQTKLARCMQRAEAGESEREMLKNMQRVDRSRSANRSILTDKPWGKPESYHLCINTSHVQEVKSLVEGLKAYVEAWFAAQEATCRKD